MSEKLFSWRMSGRSNYTKVLIWNSEINYPDIFHHVVAVNVNSRYYKRLPKGENRLSVIKRIKLKLPDQYLFSSVIIIPEEELAKPLVIPNYLSLPFPKDILQEMSKKWPQDELSLSIILDKYTGNIIVMFGIIRNTYKKGIGVKFHFRLMLPKEKQILLLNELSLTEHTSKLIDKYWGNYQSPYEKWRDISEEKLF